MPGVPQSREGLQRGICASHSQLLFIHVGMPPVTEHTANQQPCTLRMAMSFASKQAAWCWAPLCFLTRLLPPSPHPGTPPFAIHAPPAREGGGRGPSSAGRRELTHAYSISNMIHLEDMLST